MTPEKRREIASKGGSSVAPENRSFSKDKKLAARAGSIGGNSVNPENRSFAKDRALAVEAGRKGAQVRRAGA
ncbi:MAG: general stress protein [Beijerinckiaceae bacterium]